MRFVLKQDEIKQIVSAALQAKFQASYPFECTASPSYGEWTWEEATPEFKKAQAESDAYMANLVAKYKAEEEAKKAADTAVDIASKPGPF